MNRKYQTKASKAEEQVIALLKNEKNIIKPWSLVSYHAKNRTLQTTASEVPIILNNHTHVRPGFEIDKNNVYIPNLFVKVLGRDEDLSGLYDIEIWRKRDGCFVYSSFHEFCPEQNIDQRTDKLLDEGGCVDRIQLLQSEQFLYSFLRKDYQVLYIEKMNECLAEKDNLFTARFDFVNKPFMLSAMLGIDKELIEAFNRFDYQYQPPAIIIQSAKQERVTPYQGAQLMLLNKLGFDIIIESSEGHADIENIINPEYYCIFHGNGREVPSKRRKILYFRIAGVAFLVMATILIKPLFLSSRHEVEPPAESNKIVQNINQEKEKGTVIQNIHEDEEKKTVTQDTHENEGEKTAIGTETDKNTENMEIEVAPIEDGTITFKDTALEALVSKSLQKEGAVLTHDDVEYISNLYITGPNIGHGELKYTTGYSEHGYYDQQGRIHDEEGSVQNLSDLISFNGLRDLSIEWQNKLDISALKKLKTLRQLSLCHDHIKTIESLSTMTGLTRLNLSYNEISDISPLEGMTRMNGLDLQYNEIDDISVLSSFRDLEVLVLASNPLGDASALKGLKSLKMLILSDTVIRDFQFLSEMTNLEMLAVGQTYFSNLNDIRNLKSLQTLDISNTKVKDISVLKELPNLRTVYLHDLHLDDESILKELKGVQIVR